MKNLITSHLLGLNTEALKKCSSKTQRNFLNLGYSLLFVAVLSVASGVKLMSLFTENTYFIILGGSITFGIVFFMDYILATSDTNKFGAFFRALFGLLNSTVSAICMLLLINGTDIVNYKNSENNLKINELKENYKTDKENRYKIYHDQLAANENYRSKVVEPEALNVYAGEQYKKKNEKYINDNNELLKMKKALDSVEMNSYQSNFKEIGEIEKNTKTGLFEEIDIMFQKVIPASVSSMVWAVIILLVFFILEMSVLIIKFSQKNKDYDSWLDTIDTENQKVNAHLFLIKNGLKRVQQELLLKYDHMCELIAMQKAVELINASGDHPPLNNKLISSEVEIARKEFLNQYNYELNNASETQEDDHEDVVEIKSDDKGTKNTGETPNQYNIYYMTQPMKKLCDELIRKSNGDHLQFSKELFHWAEANIKYQDNHNLTHYKTAREVFNSKSGICGEMAILFNAFCKYVGIENSFVQVEIDNTGVAVNHACSAIKINNELILVDVAYHTYRISHQKWTIVSDKQLMINMINWNL